MKPIPDRYKGTQCERCFYKYTKNHKLTLKRFCKSFVNQKNPLKDGDCRWFLKYDWIKQ